MKKHRIVLASILKPVDETRMFEKIGTTLAEHEDYEITIIGLPWVKKSTGNNIIFSPLGHFSRISLRRLLAPWLVLKKIIGIKPELIVITTHELLIITLLYRLFKNVKIIYDVQENYYMNIRYTNAFPPPLRMAIALWVRGKEKFSSYFIDWFFLAEKGYEKEFSFFKNRYTVIENKFKKPNGFERKADAQNLNLLFSGTLADSTGVREAIRFTKVLHGHDATVALTIIGFCAKAETLAQLEASISGHSFIKLTGGDKLVSHVEIINAISQANFGIISYPMSKHVENSIPTKLYEYMGCQLPILLQNHQPWIDIARPYTAAIVIDFQAKYAARTLELMRTTRFYPTVPENVYWESEIPKLLHTVASVLR